eukprot:TRINITY_DN21216_c1_g1_i1.p1 TRINITY_DN21216_c1_g1~~TRINITY_DN21216_c1_g1_i1.p1  ORF type:complete len:233 (-),score=40.55 TRINITY_DN21216_c1_g1_i1:232-930(-)
MFVKTVIASFDCSEVCSSRVRVWKMFIEPTAGVAKLQHCSMAPASCFVPEVTSGQGVFMRLDIAAVSPGLASRLDAISNVETSHGAISPPALSAERAACEDIESVEVTSELQSSDRTLLVRDLPCKVGYERLMKELKDLGLDGCYDFLYLPKSLRDRHANRGFCFINFMSPEAVALFVAKFTSFRFEGIQSQKSARIGRASVQGRKANVARLLAVRNRVQFKADADGLRASG